MRKRDLLADQRRYLRKKIDLSCNYRPARSSEKVRLSGYITNISLGGIGIETSVKNAEMYSHVKGDLFKVYIVLPDRKILEMECKLNGINKDLGSGNMLVGMSINAMSPGARKLLGFFMMP